MNTTLKNLAHDSTKHYIAKDTFAIAFAMDDNGNNLLMDPQYFEITFYNGFYTRVPENGTYLPSYNEIPYDFCGQNYPYVDRDTYQRIKLENYVCPTSNEYYLSSDFFGDVFADFEFTVKKCENNTQNNNH